MSMLSKDVCFHCMKVKVWDLRSDDALDPPPHIDVGRDLAEARWGKGFVPCGFAFSLRFSGIHEPPPKKCPYKFEHGVAAARGSNT